jgi:hypothetical protein
MSLHLPFLALAALATASPALAAQRNFTVTDFSRVRVDGPYRVQLATGVAPYAKASGSPAALDGVSIEVQGQTLIVRKNPSSWGGYPGESPGPVEISVGTHDLTNVWLNGAGALKVDAVRGQSLDLSLVGAGSVAIDGLQVDRLNVGVTGSGSAILAGKVAQATAIVRGTGMLDASALTAKDARVGAEGSAVVRLAATGTARVDSQGTATVEMSGGPSCTVKATGSAVVSGCR